MGLLWSNTSKLNTSSHLTDYELSDHMVFDRGQIRPAGEMYLKTENCNKLILWSTLHNSYHMSHVNYGLMITLWFFCYVIIS